MRISRWLVWTLLMASVIGCGGVSDTPEIAGAWTLMLTPHAPGSSASLPGVTLGVTFAQDGTHLSGTVTTVNNQSTACLVGIDASSIISLSGTVEPVPTGDVPPQNLALALTFTPAGAISTQTINLAGHATKEPSSIQSLYEIPGASTDCVEGFYTLTRIN